MGRAQTIRLGPFNGGINAASDPSSLADSEVIDMTNFEVDIDGSLVGRPPIQKVISDTANWNERMVAIGQATLAGVNYVIFSNHFYGTIWYRDDNNSWGTIAQSLYAKVAIQYRDKLYIIAAETTPVVKGGYWDGVTYTQDASMPNGEAAVFHKGRLFVIPGAGATINKSRLSYTDAITSDTLSWDAALNIIDVSPGDGSNLVDIQIYDDNLILFKQDSTYVLAFDDEPTSGILRSINTTIGATAYRCVVSYENSIFVYHEGKVYEMVNYDFTWLNIKVPFKYETMVVPWENSTWAEPVSLSLMGARLVVRYYGRVYVYGLLTHAWTRWETSQHKYDYFGPLVEMPSNPTQSVLKKYYAGYGVLDPVLASAIIGFQDGWNTNQEIGNGISAINMVCAVQTKNYDFGDSQNYKKLLWWGAEIFGISVTTNGYSGDMIAISTPIVSTFNEQWTNLVETISARSTHSIFSAARVTTALNRAFLRFGRMFRFRQVNFYFSMSPDGSTVTGPCRLFALSATVSSREQVSKGIT